MTHAFFFGPQFSPSWGAPSRSSSFTLQSSVRPPVSDRPRPAHLPSLNSQVENDNPDGSAIVPAYNPRSSSPPPAYSPTTDSDIDEYKSFLHSDLESRIPRVEEEGEDEGCGKMSNVVITILIVLNVFVWSAVFYGVICDDEAPKLWVEIQRSDRAVFDE